MKRLLVISGSFPPSSAVGAQRPLKLVRRIQEFGWKPYVLTISIRCAYPVDPNLGKDVLASTHIERVPCGSIWQHTRIISASYPRDSRRIGFFLTKALNRFVHSAFPPRIDFLFPWAVRATNAGIALVKKHKIDLVWATAPDLSYLYLAHRIWEKTNVPYVIDFRDIQYQPDIHELSAKQQRHYNLEQKIARKAAGITYVAPQQGENISRKHPCTADTN